MKRVNLQLSEEVYLELVKRYGVRGLSRGVEELLRRALLAGPMNVENAKAEDVVTSKTSSVFNAKALNVENARGEGAAAPLPQPDSSLAPAPKVEGEPLTERQLTHILELLGRNRWNWLDIKDVVEHELGAALPDSPEDLGKALASRVIDLLREWERKPSREEIAEARKLLKQLPEDYAEQFNFPESVSQARKYHVALVRYALAKLQQKK